jgi:hypothetical protein
MELEKYIDKTDLILYNTILNLINRDWDKLDSSQLSELLDKLRELHQNLDNVILQRKQNDLFSNENFKSIFDRDGIKESIDLKSISLSKIIQFSQFIQKQLTR